MIDDEMHTSVAVAFLDSLATDRPKDVHQYEDKLIAAMHRNESIGVQVSCAMVKLATDAVSGSFCPFLDEILSLQPQREHCGRVQS
jgi:hypothetical protein